MQLIALMHLARRRNWLALLLTLSGGAAQAQLAGGTYTINPAGTGATNFPTFTAAVNALNVAGGTGNVTFLVAPGTYAETVPALRATAGGSATRRITFQEATLTPSVADNPVIVPPGSTATTDAGITITSADYVTFDGINVDGSAVNTVEYGYLVRNTATDGAKNNTIRNARIVLNRTNVNSAGVFQTSSATGGGATATSSPAGVNQANTYELLQIENAYKGIYLLTGNTTNFGFDYQNIVRDNVIGASVTAAPNGSIGNNVATVTAGIQAVRQNELRLYNNEVQNITGSGIGYGVSIEAAYGATLVYANRIHDVRNTSATSTSIVYGLRLDVANVGTGHQLLAYNNFVYGITHAFAGTATATVRVIGLGTNITSSTVAGTGIDLYYNTVRLANLPGYTASSVAFSQNLNTGPVLTLRNNIFADFSPAQTGVAKHCAINSETATQFGPTGSTSNYNDLYVANAGTSVGGYIGLTGTTNRLTLADWRAAVTKDANSISADPLFVAPTDLHAANVLLDGAGTPATTITTVDIDGETRHATTPDIGADEFTPVPDDVAVVSIDGPTTPAVPGLNPVRVTIRNGGTAVLTAATLRYVLNANPAVSQAFTGLSLAPGATRQLTFTTGLTAPSGTNTLTVTGSLPNGNADGNPANNSQTITFNQPTPDNDEPCTALPLGSAAVASSNSGASSSQQLGIVLPACSPAAAPLDVWFTAVPAGNRLTLALAGTAAGMVRVFTTPDCAAGPFTQVFCQSSGANNTSVGTVTVPNLTPGQRYYIAVSGYGSADVPGAFTISGTVLGNRLAQATELAVFPNPSTGGLLTVRVAAGTSGRVELRNALGQLLRQQPLAGAETQLATTGLAAGLYTVQVQLAGQTLSRKVVLQ